MGSWLSREEATVVPALLRCDGYYKVDGFDGGSFRSGWAEAAIALTSYCGWLRFEGNGGAMLRTTEDMLQTQIRATWDVVSATAVRLTFLRAPQQQQPESLIVEEGDTENVRLPLAIEPHPKYSIHHHR